GLSMARKFVELGAHVFICGRREEVVKKAAADLGPRATAFQCDIRDPQAIEIMLDRIWESGPLDSLVNNAAGNFLARSEDLSPRALDAILSIVVHGTSYMTLACG